VARRRRSPVAAESTPEPETIEIHVFQVRLNLQGDERRPCQLMVPEDITGAELMSLIAYLSGGGLVGAIMEARSPAGRLRAAGLVLPGSGQ
jgi:hypothetical protein